MNAQTWFSSLDKDNEVAIFNYGEGVEDYMHGSDLPAVIEHLTKQYQLYNLRKDNGLHINSTETR